MIVQVYSVSGQTEGKKKAFFEWKSIDLAYELSLTCGGNVLKVFIILFLLVRIENIMAILKINH